MKSMFDVVFLFIVSSFLLESDYAFSVPTRSTRILHDREAMSSVILSMAKARARNNQTELRKKMEEAKKQNQENDVDSGKDNSKLSEQKIKERNDRLRFEELLKTGAASVLNDYSSDGYLSKQQEEEEISAALSGADRLFEGDPAPTDCFEELVSIKSENAIGTTGKQRLVPWLHKNSARHDDYLVIITEPRMKSSELYETIKTLIVELPAEIRARLIIVNADSPAENRRWLKKSGLDDDKVHIYSDEKREFMREYTAMGKDRLYMTLFVISDRKIQKLARDIDQYGASRTVQNAVKALGEVRLKN